MTKLVAVLALVALAVLNQLGTFWIVYGIWPRSWGAFILFGLASMVIGALLNACMASED